MKQLASILIFAAMPIIGFGQTTVSGNILNERGEKVEYVSIGFNRDSVGTISDGDGHFSLKIPAGRTNTLVFSHVSYLPTEIPFETYSAGNELTIVLKDKMIVLPEVTVGKQSKPKTIVGRGMPMPGSCVLTGRGTPDGPEGGPMFTADKDYIISNILLKIEKCTYKECKLSFNLYERRDSQLVNVLQKPIYQTLQQSKKGFTLDVEPTDILLLKRGTEYYLSVSMVDSEGEGTLMLDASMKSGYFRKGLINGEIKKVPVCPAFAVKGIEL
ncbi:MAG: carboxypeptidase-like regulatory domain-containing protein [Salinivirgaceae bacterium]|nr:carboxypeptidase-like regulatory domain-containing protein [Salinivirgaceae bacterium]